jgi:hypothetical protein
MRVFLINVEGVEEHAAIINKDRYSLECCQNMRILHEAAQDAGNVDELIDL